MLTKKRLLESVNSIHDLDLEKIQKIVQESVNKNESLLAIAGPMMTESRQIKAQRKIVVGKTILHLLQYVKMLKSQKRV